MKEKAVAQRILLEAAQRDMWLGRNNSGGFYDETGRFVRYGLGAFTEADAPVFIMPEMVGRILPVFTAIETKPQGWKFNNSVKRELHQSNFIDMIRNAGGKAGFAQSVEDFRKIIDE
jgi:hypothetical protein